MNRDEAKTKDRKASREDCRRVIETHGPSNAKQVSEYLKAEGLKITPNAANCRMLEDCEDGNLWRVDLDKLWVYNVTPAEKKAACIAFYKEEKRKRDLARWSRATETLLPTLTPRLQKHLKALTNEINKVA